MEMRCLSVCFAFFLSFFIFSLSLTCLSLPVSHLSLSPVSLSPVSLSPMSLTCLSSHLSLTCLSLPVSQAYVQCGEDDGDREVQTDVIEVLDRWTQHPADHTGACGGKTG